MTRLYKDLIKKKANTSPHSYIGHLHIVLVFILGKMVDENRHVFSRVLKICSGNPGSLKVFAEVSKNADPRTFEKIVCTAENMQWTSSEAYSMFKDHCNSDIQIFMCSMLDAMETL